MAFNRGSTEGLNLGRKDEKEQVRKKTVLIDISVIEDLLTHFNNVGEEV